MYFNIFNGADLEAMGDGLLSWKGILSILIGLLIGWLIMGDSWKEWKQKQENNNKPVEVLENKLDF